MEQIKAAIQKLNARERTLSLVIVFALTLVTGKMFVIDEALVAWDTFGKISSTSLEAERNRVMLEELSKAPAENIRKSPYWVYRQENSGLGNFIRRVSSSGEGHHGFTVRKISVDKAEKLPEFDKTKLEVEVEGPFQTIGAFLEELEASRFLTRVEEVHVYRIEKELRLCRARIKVDSFSWREL